ncbi:MAG: TetR/AcrR family transcriptional regulator [Alphaproteobacteria bacterium]
MTQSQKSRTKKDVVIEFRVAEIIDAARRVIVREGFRNASMDKIAEEAKISKGTLYLYFDSKEALVRQAAERGHAEMAKAIANLTTKTTEPVAAIDSYVRAMLRFCDENEIVFRAMHTHPDSVGDPNANLVNRRIDEYVATLERFIKELIKAGAFRKVNARRLSRIIVEAVRGVVIERLREAERDRPTIDDEAKALMEIILRGVGA